MLCIHIWVSAFLVACILLGANSVSLRVHHEKYGALRHGVSDVSVPDAGTAKRAEHLVEKPKHKSHATDKRVRACVDRYADDLDLVEYGLGGIIRSHTLVPAAHSNRQVILGAGSGNTGTHSIFHALQEFGFVTWHAAKNKTWDKKRASIRDILGWRPKKGYKLSQVLTDCQHELRNFNYTWLLDGCDAVVDMPTAEIFLDLFLSFPNARVILSTRPSSSWAESRMRTHPGTAAPIQEPCADMNSQQFTPAKLGQLYELNNDLVRCLVPRERLLELDFWADSAERVRGMMGELQNFVAEISPPATDNESKATRHKFPHIKPSPRKFEGSVDTEFFRSDRPLHGGPSVHKSHLHHSKGSLNLDFSGREHNNSGTHDTIVDLRAKPMSCEEGVVLHNGRRLPGFRDYFVEASDLAHKGCDLI